MLIGGTAESTERVGARDENRGRRKAPVGAFIIHESQADLFQVVRALNPPGGLAGGLNGRKQQCNQDGDDCDDNQQLDQGETTCESSPGIQA
jgi:hypothetical protein